MAPPPCSYSWAAVRMGVVQGIDYLERNLCRFMRPARRHQNLRPEAR
jgi:hypothetical protein